MTPEEINVAIAKACGWHNIKQNPMLLGNQLAGTYSENDDALYAIPNYYSDLNACFEMECKLPNSKSVEEYHKRLREVTRGGDYVSHLDRSWHATAPQRCESFLKILNIWKE